MFIKSGSFVSKLIQGAPVFFQRLAGFDSAKLKQCETSEQTEATQLGVSMIPASGLAGFAAAFFVYIATGSVIVAVVAFIASVCITLITDRSILMAVASAGEASKHKYKQFLLGCCRILLSFCLSSLTSSAITQYLTRDEITAELDAVDNEAAQKARAFAEQSVAAQANRLPSRKHEIEADLKFLRQRFDEKDNEAIKEHAGKAISKEAGPGKLWREKRQAAEKAEFEYVEARKRYEAELSDIDTQLKTFRAQADQVSTEAARLSKLSRGSLSKQKALMRLVKSDFGALTYYVTIVLILSLVELLPLIGAGISDLAGYRTLIGAAKEPSHERGERIANARRAREHVDFLREQAKKLIRSKIAQLVAAVAKNTEGRLAEDEKALVAQVSKHSIAKLSAYMEILNVDDAQQQVPISVTPVSDQNERPAEPAPSATPTSDQNEQPTELAPAAEDQLLHVVLIEDDLQNKSWSFSLYLRNPNLSLLRDFTGKLFSEAQQRLPPEQRLPFPFTQDNLLFFNSADDFLVPGDLFPQLRADRVVRIRQNGGYSNAIH